MVEQIKIEDMLSKEDKTVWVTYPETDFEVQLRYIRRPDLTKIFDKSQKTVWDKKTHLQEKQTDSDAFYRLFIQKAFVTWKGLTIKILAKMVDISVTGDPEQEIPFSPDNAFTLMRHAYDFDVFIQRTVMDLGQFSVEQLEDEKKT
jgi:hypothetical protein